MFIDDLYILCEKSGYFDKEKTEFVDDANCMENVYSFVKDSLQHKYFLNNCLNALNSTKIKPKGFEICKTCGNFTGGYFPSGKKHTYNNIMSFCQYEEHYEDEEIESDIENENNENENESDIDNE